MSFMSLGRRALLRGLMIATFAILAGGVVLVPAARSEDAKPFLHPLFADNMVLQRSMADPIWGWAAPGTLVTVQMEGKTVRAIAGGNGQWTTKIGPFPAGGPYTLTVSGPQTVTVKNVLVGDVWLCSGQSNMQFGIGNLLNAQDEIAKANYPNIRLMYVPERKSNTPNDLITADWKVCTPEVVASDGSWGGFSAVAYFFGRDLHQKLNVPIGLIHSSWGGTPAQAWTSGRALKTMPDFRPTVEAMEAAATNPPAYDQLTENWYAKHDAGTAAGAGWNGTALDTSGWETLSLPGQWESAGIPALASFDGVVWFRREIDLPAGWTGKEAMLNLGPIDDRDTTWVNGVKVGGLSDYAAPRSYKVPASALKPGRNVIAVRVLDTGNAGGFTGKREDMTLTAAGQDPVSLAGAWAYKIGSPLPADDPAPMLPGGTQNDPTVLFNAMIAPLVPYGITGAIWYQGESNAGAGKQYQTLLPTMITDWRSRFGQTFPFLIVQLANFTNPPVQPGESDWAELREAQMMTAQTLPETGLATAIDIGEAGDIHPKNKQEVGRRLALTAEGMVYGLPVHYQGPEYRSMVVEGSKIRVKFAHTDGGLVAKGGPLTGFAIAGADGKFVWADAVIDGDSVVVSAPSVASPTDVRYAWATNPVANLDNGDGLPATPFRTGK